MNNHMGSAATANMVLMQHLMQQLAKMKLFFLDSRTTADTVTFQVAKQQGVPILARNIFLDDSNEYADIQYQFQQAIKYAQQYGTAIVIGHPRKNTLKVLQQELKNLPTNIKLTKISELWQQQTIPAKPFNLFFADIKL